MAFWHLWKKRDRRHFKGSEARIKAERALDEARAQRHDVHRVARSLHTHKENNDFANKITRLIVEGRKAG